MNKTIIIYKYIRWKWNVQ